MVTNPVVPTQKKPPPAAWRWTVLVAISVAMFGNYYVYDSVAPVADLLQRQVGYTDTQIGLLNAIFQHAHGVTLQEAGALNGYVFLAAIVATPLFGLLADRVGRRAAFMAFGCGLLAATFPILAYTDASLWVSTVLVGIAFSLIPAIIWPAMAYLVEPSRLGTAYGLMTMVQATGMTVINVVAGALNAANGASAENPSGQPGRARVRWEPDWRLRVQPRRGQRRQNAASLRGWPLAHAAWNVTLTNSAGASRCSRRSAMTRKANAWTRATASSRSWPYAKTPDSPGTSASHRPSSSRSISTVNVTQAM